MNDYLNSYVSSFTSPDWNQIEDLVGRKLFFVTAQHALPDGLAGDLASAGAELYHGGYLEGRRSAQLQANDERDGLVEDLKNQVEDLTRQVYNVRGERLRWETMYVTLHMNQHTDGYKNFYEDIGRSQIALIKDVRNTLGVGLKAAKDAADAWVDTHYPPVTDCSE